MNSSTEIHMYHKEKYLQPGQVKHGGLINKGVRYQVKEVQRSIAFYTKMLGFNLDQQNLPAFGQVSIRNLKLILSGPGASGSRPMPDGRQQEPGGWNRIVLQVQDLSARIADLKKERVHFRNEMEVGPAADRSKWKTQMATRLSYFSLLGGKRGIFT
jgi:glyoxylase I family protein